VLEALTNIGPKGVAVAVTQWGGPDEAKVIVPFTRVSSPREAKAFGFRIGRARRAFLASSTSIATAILHGVSGDGVDNGGLDLDAARDAALNAGIVVNGLPIDADNAQLADYYRGQVIIGTDCFIERAAGFDDYARAIREKLIRELRPLGS